MKSATDEGEREKLELVLMNILQVYDFEDNEKDIFRTRKRARAHTNGTQFDNKQ